MAAAIKRSFWPVYLSLIASVVIGLIFVSLFEAYSTADFEELADFLRDNTESLQDYAADRREEGEIGPLEELTPEEQQLEREFRNRVEGRIFQPVRGVGGVRLILLQVLAVGFWLAPVYRHVYAREGEYTAQVERRILNTSLAIVSIPWIFGALDLGIKFLRQYQELGSFEGRNYAVYVASFLIYGALVSHFNLSVTSTYVTNTIADQVFQGDTRYRLKRGAAVTIAGRVALLILSVALLPLLLNIYIPIVFNAWLLEEIRSSASPDWLQLARILAPIVVTLAANLYFILAQIFSILAFRRNIQRPINRLIEQMGRVARGDLGTRSSVLTGDEIGSLKGHFNLMVEGLQERERLRDTFGRYVSMEIAEKLMRSGDIDLSGEEIETTVMFTDIRDFTSFSERHTPKELVEFLNLYLSYMVMPIQSQRGVVNKFIGDAIMALFSPVFGVEDHAAAALRAALGMRAALEDFNALGRYEPIRHGVGLHTGPLVAGSVGTEHRREYTVIGDTVNVASRIESQTKIFDTDILLSEETFTALPGHSDLTAGDLPGQNRFQATEPVTLRGKSEPVALYRVG